MADHDPILESLLAEQARVRTTRVRRRRVAGVLCVVLLPTIMIALALRSPLHAPSNQIAQTSVRVETPDATPTPTPRIERVANRDVPSGWIVRETSSRLVERIDDGALNALLAEAGAPTGIVRTNQRTTLVALLTRDRVAATTNPTQTN